MVEQRPFKALVDGSSPSQPTPFSPEIKLERLSQARFATHQAHDLRFSSQLVGTPLLSKKRRQLKQVPRRECLCLNRHSVAPANSVRLQIRRFQFKV